MSKMISNEQAAKMRERCKPDRVCPNDGNELKSRDDGWQCPKCGYFYGPVRSIEQIITADLPALLADREERIKTEAELRKLMAEAGELLEMAVFSPHVLAKHAELIKRLKGAQS